MLSVFQKGFHYSQDGPGNRLIYHLQGCNLRCPWCSNPEGLSVKGGTAYPVSELVDEVIRSRPMFFDGGGVTLTGGEVTMQADGALKLLSSVHAHGISTCIETNGISDRLPELFPYIDVLIMDIKHYDAEKHRCVTGVGNERTVKNLSLAIEAKKNIIVRIPLIGGFNASVEDAHEFAQLFVGLGLDKHGTVEILPYHEYGKKKYEDLGMEYTMNENAKITTDMLSSFSDVLIQRGIKMIRT